jgi:hypothetical protein
MNCGVPQGSVLGPILFLLYISDIPPLINRHGLDNHLFADDTQLYGHCTLDPDCITTLRSKFELCFTDVADCMKSNRLQLNALKTEFLWCTTPRNQNKIDRTPFNAENDTITPADSVRNLGLYIDTEVSMKTHIIRLVSTCFGILRQLKSIIRSLPNETLQLLIHCFITSRIDYCNVAFAGLPSTSLNRIQSVMNASARLVCGSRKYDHITPLLRDQLHWLKVPERITYKLCLLVYKCIHGIGPAYLCDFIIPVSTIASRQRLRSSKSLNVLVPSTNLRVGERAFRVAAPTAWNNLPYDVQNANTLTAFKKHLKTFLFKICYSTD